MPTAEAADAATTTAGGLKTLYARMKSEDPEIITTHSWVLDTLGLIFSGAVRMTSKAMTRIGTARIAPST